MKQYCLLVLSLLIAAGARGQYFSTAADTAATAPRPLPCLAQAAIGLGFNALITEGVKHSIHQMRPDRNGNNSFPSRHTSWAFAGATIISNNTYRFSPAWPMAAHAAATAVGFQRVAARRHYASDVVAGAATGIASAELGFILGRLIHGSTPAPRATAWDGFHPTLALTSEALYTIAQPGDTHLCTGFATTMRLSVPLASHHGICISLQGSASPAKNGGNGPVPLVAAGLSTGWTAQFALPHKALALSVSAEGGTMKLFRTDGWDHHKWTALVRADASLLWRLTDSFAASAGISARVVNPSRATAAIGISVGSVAIF